MHILIHITSTTELYNGNVWYNSFNMNINRYSHSVCNMANNALATGGIIHNPSSNCCDYTNTSEIFNGITWTNTANMNINRYSHSACTNALVTGGCCLNTTEIFKNIEKYNLCEMRSYTDHNGHKYVKYIDHEPDIYILGNKNNFQYLSSDKYCIYSTTKEKVKNNTLCDEYINTLIDNNLIDDVVADILISKYYFLNKPSYTKNKVLLRNIISYLEEIYKTY